MRPGKKRQTCRNGQKGFIDGVNVNIVDLIDAHDVAVSAQQSQHS